MKTIKLVNRNQVVKLSHTGRRGLAGTVAVGSVTTGAPGQAVTVTNVGTSSEAILNFVIPQGDPATNIVKSVNGKIDEVVLDTNDILDTEVRRYTNDSDISRLQNTSGTNTGDQDLSSLAVESNVASRLALKLNISDVVNNLTSSAADKALSAAQGKALKDLVDVLNQIVTSDDTSLDDLQEIVTYIKANKDTLENLSIGAIAGLQSALDSKSATNHTHTAANVTDFDTEVSNNTDVAANTAARHTHANKAVLDATTASFTTADETKLDGIAAGAQVNTVTSVNTRTGAITGLAEASDLTAHTGNTSNPHSVTKAQVGLGNVANLAPADMPVSTATQTALNAKANASDTVNLTGNQTIAGVKTFSSAPIAPSGTSIGGALHLTGVGFPNGVVTAPTGSVYIDTAVTNGASSWIKKSGTGNTGWQVLEGDTGWRAIGGLIEPSSGIADAKTNATRIRRINNTIHYIIELTATSYVSGTTFMYMIDGFRFEEVYISLGYSNIQLYRISTGMKLGFSGNNSGIRYSLTMPTSDAWPTTLPGTAV